MGLRTAANSDQMSCPRRRNCCAVCARVCVSVYRGVHVCGCVCVHRTVRVVFAHVYTCVYTHGSGEPPVHLTTRTHVYSCMGLWTRLVTACVCTPVGQVGPHPAPKHAGCLQWPQRTLKNIASCSTKSYCAIHYAQETEPSTAKFLPSRSLQAGRGEPTTARTTRAADWGHTLFSALHTLSSFHPHFTDGKTEAQSIA